MSSYCPYRRALDEAIENGTVLEEPFDDFTLKDPESTFVVIPYETSEVDPHGEVKPAYNQRIYVSGQSGCGKSRWAGKWLEEYQFLYPHKTVTAFCHTLIDNDPAYAGIRSTQFDLHDPDFQNATEEVLAGGLLDNSICLFDDIDKLEGSARGTAYRLLGQTVMMGRKAGIPVCFCNHLGTDRKATRDILNAATAAVIFPRGGSVGQLEYLARNHLGMSKRAFMAVHDMKPKWCYVHRNYPSFIITESRICTMDALELTSTRSMKKTSRLACQCDR